MERNRPIFINLFKIRFPVAAIVSVGHRASGIFMVMLVPLLIMALDRSTTAEGYAQLSEYLGQTWVRAGLFAALWAFAHHFFAGIRFLLIDCDIGVDKAEKTASAWLVQIGGLAAALLGAGGLWL